MEYFPELYRLYKQNLSNTPFRKTHEYQDYVNDPYRNTALFGGRQEVKIKVVGVFDTVGSLGVPDTVVNNNESWRKYHGFHNTDIDPLIENAFHALALDEHRKAFAPTLWYVPNDNTTTNLHQVWFPGVHINIGGGSDDGLKEKKGDLEQIATITFAWLVDQIRPFLAFDTFALNKIWNAHSILTFDPSYHGFNPNAGFRMVKKQQPQGNIVTRGYRSVLGYFTGPKEDEYEVWQAPKVGYATGTILDAYDATMYKAGGEAKRTPGQYMSHPRAPEKPRLLSELGKTRESIHPSVWHRMQHVPSAESGEKQYKPDALVGWERKRNPDGDKKGFVWTNKDKTVTLPEYVIPYAELDGQYHCLERMLIQGHAPQLMKELDEANGIHVPEFVSPPEQQVSGVESDTKIEQSGFTQSGFTNSGF
ncbi:hypothetical protein BKA62DRAFT_60734 [Auriculariales sp. MPI-PUGE-AT-0066]|nr:hypothetical protein BKA62DRAFT_60734 [Auriculariales sp. MPI-PUGE-AT-0066]